MCLVVSYRPAERHLPWKEQLRIHPAPRLPLCSTACCPSQTPAPGYRCFDPSCPTAQTGAGQTLLMAQTQPEMAQFQRCACPPSSWKRTHTIHCPYAAAEARLCMTGSFPQFTADGVQNSQEHPQQVCWVEYLCTLQPLTRLRMCIDKPHTCVSWHLADTACQAGAMFCRQRVHVGGVAVSHLGISIIAWQGA